MSLAKTVRNDDGHGAVAAPKTGRRVSMGGFGLIEDDDFTKALGKLLGTVSPGAAGYGAESNQDGDENLGALGEAALFGGFPKKVEPYWHTGPNVDVSCYVKENQVVKPRARYTIDHAIADPNPAPRPDSLAVPPPPEIMHPDGNNAVNHRLEKCLVHNDVVMAQKVANNPSLLPTLIREGLFRRACTSCGYEPEGLLPQHRSKFKTDPITGRMRSKEEQAVAADQAEIARLKHIALVLTEYKELAATEAAKIRDARVAVRRASLSHPGVGSGVGAGASQLHAQGSTISHAGHGGGMHQSGELYSEGSASDPMRFVSLRELGVGGGWEGYGQSASASSGPSSVQGGRAREDSMTGSRASHGPDEEIAATAIPPAVGPEGSVVSMPESFASWDSEHAGLEEEVENTGEAQGERAGQRKGAHHHRVHHSAALAPPPGGYPADILTEAEAVGLDPGLVWAARLAKEQALAKLAQVEERTAAIIAAARVSVSTVSAGSVSGPGGTIPGSPKTSGKAGSVRSQSKLTPRKPEA